METKSSDVSSGLEAMDGLVNPEVIKGIRSKTSKNKEPEIVPEGTAPAIDVDKVEPKKIEVASPFGSEVYKDLPGSSDPEITTFEDVVKYAETVGVDVKSPGDFKKVFGELVELKKTAADMDLVKTKVSNYEAIFSSLPEDISAVVNAYLNGEDYKEVISQMTSKGGVDFSKDFSSHNVVDLINLYTEESLDGDAWEDMDDKSRNALTSVAKRAYVFDQKEYKESLTRPQRVAEEFRGRFSQSVDTSLTKLAASYPSMDKSRLERVKKIMEADLHSTLFNPDNTYRPEAAERIAFQEFGKETIAQYQHTIGDIVKMYDNSTESKVVETVLRKSDNPSTDQGRNVTDPTSRIAKIVEEQTGFLKK